MVHTFGCLGRLFALDVESGSIFEVDEITKSLIEKISLNQRGQGDFSVCSEAEREALKEINSLVDEGLLFSPAPNTTIHSGQNAPIIKSLCFNVCHGCNLACAYCFAGQDGGGGGTYNTGRQSMSLEVAKAAIDFLIEKSAGRKTLEADFFGGEPLINFEVVKQTVAYARQKEKESGKKFRFTVTTNAYSLTDDIIDYFNEEMHNVVISLDGRKEIHDKVRPNMCGDPTFEKSLANALKFRKKRGDKQYYIRGTFTALNSDFSRDVLFLNDCGFDQISLEPVVLPQKHPLAFENGHLPYLKNEYETLAKEYIERRKGEKWFNFFHFMQDLSGGPCLKKRLSGCGAGFEYLCVSPDGGLYPCHRFDGKPEYLMGNVLTKTLDLEQSKRFGGSNLNTKEHCKDCFCKYFCSGGCAANSIEYGGGIDLPYEFSCELMKKRTETAIAIYAIENAK